MVQSSFCSFLAFCVPVFRQGQNKPPIQLSMYMICLYLWWRTSTGLSLFLRLLVCVDHPLFVSSEVLDSFFFTFSLPPACLRLPPSFPLHRFWLASVKPLKRKCLSMFASVCAHKCVYVCVGLAGLDLNKPMPVLPRWPMKWERQPLCCRPPLINLPGLPLRVRICMAVYACVCQMCVFAYV